jgi:hypothetical protein
VMNCGVYQIKHKATGRVYIGSSMNIRTRLKWHRNALRRGGHHSRKLQRAWNKYGEAAFEFSILLYCAPDLRKEYEQRLIDGWGLVEAGWNCSKSAEGPVLDITPEYRAKMVAAQRAIAKKYEWRGQMLCLYEIAELEGVSPKVLLSRFCESGWSLERAVTTPVMETNRKPEGFGKSQPIKEWASELGMIEASLRVRLSGGESIEEIALSQKRISVGELSRLFGWAPPVVRRRIRCGWDVGDALMLPANAGKRREFVRNAPVGGLREMAL